MEKMKMHSLNKVDDNIRRIGALFPNCVTERKNADGEIEYAIDFDMLRQELSTVVVEGNEERYQFTWPDKKKTILAANAPISDTLRPCRDESVDFDNTRNLYIEGDNLTVLKLLQETYLGRIKMIYIDPPYNTGNDFVYNDDFAESVGEYIAHSGQIDEDGNRLVTNSESNGRFHTDWLNMIYPRLKLAKDLLAEDGVIFISLDDNEIENLIKCCDEIFGSANHIGLMTIMSNPRGSQNSRHLSNIHEYILMYAKNASILELKGISKSEESLSEFNEVDETGRKYRALGLRKRGGAWRKEDRPNMFYPIYVNPSNGKCSLEKSAEFCIEVIPMRPTGELSRWTWGKEKFAAEKDILIGRRVNRSGETESWDIFRKDYIDNADGEEKTTKIKTIWTEKETNYQNAKNEIKALFGNSEVFDFPKPTYIVQQLASMLYLDEDDIILDFFSGSSSTAQAVMQLNAQFGTTVSFIMVQIAEEIGEKSQAYKLGYHTICEIGKERIRRAGKLVTDEAGIMAQNLDVGFRVLKLDSSNMKDVYYNPDEYEITMFDSLTDNIKEDRTPEDLLFQVMLDLGVLLSSKIEETTIAGKRVFNVADGFLIACFDNEVTEDTITAIAKQKPYDFVMRDSSMASDSVATNFEQIFATYSPDTVRKVL